MSGLASGDVLLLVIKVTVLLGMTGMVATVCRRAPARVRHALWSAGLLMVLVMPAVVVAMPALEWVPRWATPVAAVESKRTAAGAAGASPDVASRLEGTGPSVLEATGEVEGRKADATVPPMVDTATGVSQRVAKDGWALPSLGTILLMTWGAGALVLLLPLALSPVLLRRHAGASAAEDAAWAELLTEVRKHFHLRRRVVLRFSERTAVPLTFGLFVPVVLLPADARDWPHALRRQVLLHELAHIRRYDVVALLLARLVRGVYWFHPFVWHGTRAIHLEAERAADELVLAAGTRASDYAETLVQFGRNPASGWMEAGVVLSVGHRSMLEQRVRGILDPRQARRGAAWPWLLVALGGGSRGNRDAAVAGAADDSRSAGCHDSGGSDRTHRSTADGGGEDANGRRSGTSGRERP